jgi:DNA-binding MarR family transcriptional regulator/N-acetylglutamate synthase-like GNAT family acetyltransferase
MDTIDNLAELAFASRLKRLSDRLIKDVSQVYKHLEVDFDARWFAMLYTLFHESPQSITKLAESLSITHTAVNQLSSELIKKGLIKSRMSSKDERIRLLFISPKGIEVANSLSPVWDEIKTATKELLCSVDSNLITLISKLEEKLNQQNMYERVWLKLKGRRPGKIEILEYRPAYKKYFASLNEEWLNEDLEVEIEDQKMLSDPNGQIIKKGGAIFFACFNNQIVGTCALIIHKNGTYELAKMAVAKEARKMGIGRELANKTINHSKSNGANELYLQTSEKLKIANYLYQSLGFAKIQKSPLLGDRYKRPTYTMKLKLGRRSLTPDSIN